MILKISFADLHVLRGKSFEAARPILGMFFDVYDLHGILDARCWMSHRRWRNRRSFWPDFHGISR